MQAHAGDVQVSTNCPPWVQQTLPSGNYIVNSAVRIEDGCAALLATAPCPNNNLVMAASDDGTGNMHWQVCAKQV